MSIEEDPTSPNILSDENNEIDLIIPDEINNIYILYFQNLIPILTFNQKKNIIEKWNIFKSINLNYSYKQKILFLSSCIITK